MKTDRVLFRFKSIRTSMMLSFAVLVVSALAIFLIFSMHFTKNAVLENAGQYTSRLVNQMNVDIDSYINYMENISQMVTESSDASKFLWDVGGSYWSGSRKAAKEQLEELFATILSTRSDICNIGILADNSRYLINDTSTTVNAYGDLEKKEWYRKTREAAGDTVVSSSHVQNIVQDSYDWVVTLSRALVDPKTEEIGGIFFIDLNYNAIRELCEHFNLGNKGYLFILDDQGGIVYHPKQQLLYNGLKTERIDEVMDSQNGSFVTKEGKESKLYTVSRSAKTGWTVVGVAYTSELVENQEEMRLTYLLAAVLLFGAALVFAAILSEGITRPVKELKNSMKEVEQGHFDKVSVAVRGENEIASLNKSFNIMAARIQELMEEIVREQKEKRKSELQALQAQINPHFLYNTLDSIIWMAEWGKNKEVILMTSSLAKLLRQSISNEKELVTVGQEIEYTRSYLTIQQMRYKDQMEFQINVPEEILEASMVKLVIQPLVENAIYHSIKYMEEKGCIQIIGKVENGVICIDVRDNGVGMEPEVLEHILEPKPAEPGKKRRGVGVFNVQNRLQLHYGKEYGLTYESWKGKGTVVHIRVPWIKEEKEKKDEREKE